MKSLALRCFLILTLIIPVACGDDPEPGVAENTWTFAAEGQAVGAYRKKSITLSTQTYQVVEALSEDNPGGGYVGVNSTLRLYFATVGPPPTGTYTVTSIDKLSGHTDQVAISLYTWGDPANGLSQTYWYSPENSGQSISYTFADGKVKASFTNINVGQVGSTGPTKGVVSANISQ